MPDRGQRKRIVIGCNARYSKRFGFTGKSLPIALLPRKSGFLLIAWLAMTATPGAQPRKARLRTPTMDIPVRERWKFLYCGHCRSKIHRCDSSPAFGFYPWL